jgi:hypothetical protein
MQGARTLMTIGSSWARTEDANRTVPVKADVTVLKAFILTNAAEIEWSGGNRRISLRKSEQGEGECALPRVDPGAGATKEWVW